MIQYCLWNDTDCTFETKWTRMKYCKPLPWLLVGLWTEAKNTLSFFSVKNFSLFGLLCMNTPFSSPLSIERISIAFSPQPMTSLELLIWLTERGFSPQFKIASWKIIRSGFLVRFHPKMSEHHYDVNIAKCLTKNLKTEQIIEISIF